MVCAREKARHVGERRPKPAAAATHSLRRGVSRLEETGRRRRWRGRAKDKALIRYKQAVPSSRAAFDLPPARGAVHGQGLHLSLSRKLPSHGQSNRPHTGYAPQTEDLGRRPSVCVSESVLRRVSLLRESEAHPGEVTTSRAHAHRSRD